MDRQEVFNDFDRKNFLVIGDVMLDHYIWGDSARLSPEAPVPVVKIKDETYKAGGAANVAMNLASLGSKVELVSLVGDDKEGSLLQEILNNSGVKFSGWKNKDIKTIKKSRIVVQKQQLCRIDVEEQKTSYQLSLHQKNQLKDMFKDFDGIIISDYAKGVIEQFLINEIIELRDRMFIAIDPKPQNKLYYEGIDLMTPNLKEAFELAEGFIQRDNNYEELCAHIYKKYKPNKLVITMGADGMLLCENGNIIGNSPTLSKTVYDVSGAGDTVIATLSLLLSSGVNLEESAKLANIAAGIVVGKLGTATVTRGEIAKHLLDDTFSQE